MSGRNSFPFTASQWQELEHQALIFRYMVSGAPVPTDLLCTIRRSLGSSFTSNLIVHQPQHIGWNCFQMGFGRKIDPEPGRCRRTDGKKWRCSKDAYPDSKYCERHMHRGRNRSRKPVEATTTITATNNSSPNPPTPTVPISSITNSQNQCPSTLSLSNTASHPLSPLSSVPSHTHHYPHNHSWYNSQLHHSFLYPHSSSSRPPGIGLSSQDNDAPLLSESGPFSHIDIDYRRRRYGSGMKEEADEHPFFSGTSGTMRSCSGSSMDDPWQLTPLTMGSSLAHLKQRSCSGLQSGYSHLQIQGLSDASKQQQDQHFCALVGDVKCEMSLKIERDEEPKKVMHHFLDEWPPRNKDSWVDSDDKSSTTQLSISVPDSSHDFFMTRHDE